MLPSLFPFLALHLIIPLTSASEPAALNRTCTPSHDHLDPSTRKFISDCDAKSFCSLPTNADGGNGTCQARVCRRDEYAFGYAPDGSEPVPPLCADGMFCPDEGSACRPLVALGGACQFNRDDQCQPPSPDVGAALADVQNHAGAMCLRSLCTYANMTKDAPCVYELTNYATAGPGGALSTNTIVRDNCLTATLFCNTHSSRCEPRKPLGATCEYHRDCETDNCQQYVCMASPASPYTVAVWQYACTSLAIISAMAATCIMLALLHKRHRLKAYRETRDYCYEQITYVSPISVNSVFASAEGCGHKQHSTLHHGAAGPKAASLAGLFRGQGLSSAYTDQDSP
ncbi:hypothetical protein DENSPDRAFT_913393 [Dentipellis sp. KUC8613]|nr:hypothetical protein DENSPDRAFT_913393 [Dentipellis sp. KUC8613]